jgi:hypothetical protein
MENLLCDSDVDWTGSPAPSRPSGTSGPVRHSYEA